MNPHVFQVAIVRSLAAALILLGCAANPAFAAAGKIQFAIGDVKIQDSKQAARPAKKGEPVEQGDTIITGASGSVQVTLADGGMLAVRPNTQMRIDAYAYSGKADDKNNKSVFSLAKGTFRSITGAIGQNNKDAYQVNTPGATMGIRGTDHEPAVILPPPPGFPPLPPDAPQPGSYDRVNRGQTFIQTPGGLLVLNPNQVGFAPLGGGAPRVLPNVPSFYSAAPKPGAAKQTAAAGGSTASGGATSGSSSSGGTTSGGTTSSGTTSSGTTSSGTTSTNINSLSAFAATQITTITTTNIVSPTVATDETITSDSMISVVIDSGGSTLPPPPPPPPPPLLISAPLGSGLVGAVNDSLLLTGSGNAGTVYLSQSPPIQEILIGAQNEVFYFFDGASLPTIEFDSAGSALTDQGSFNFAEGGRVDWGRWISGFVFLEGGVLIATVGDFHYAFSQDITSPSLVLSGTLTGGTYGYVGGTSPTDQNGIPGMILPASTSLNVNFSAMSVIFNVGTLINGATLIGTAQGPLADFINPNTKISSISGPTVNASGQFVGPTGGGAIVGFDITDGMNGAVGTALFQRPPP